MMNFRDVSALRGILQKMYEIGGQQGQALMADALEAKVDFTKDQAKLYVSTVLSRSAERKCEQGDRYMGPKHAVRHTWRLAQNDGGDLGI